MGAIVGVDGCLMLVVNGDWKAVPQTDRSIKSWLIDLASDIDLPIHFAEIAMNNGSSVGNGLAQIVALNPDGKRKRLLLAGSHLEDAVTFECLEALAYGFDVFLPSDLIEVSDFNFVSLHWDRLKQAGAVPTTITQMLNEWSVCATDAAIIEKIRLRSQEFRKIHK